MNHYLALLIPVAAVALLGAVQWWSMRRFDREHPRLSRKALRKRERAEARKAHDA